MKKALLVITALCLTIFLVFSTTWYETKVECPVCKEVNTFQKIGSYGSYIYSWPEKLESIYWPVTESYSVYSCSKCNYTAFLWDFQSIEGDTLELIKKELKNLDLKVTGYDDKMTNKLEAAEKIYKLYITDAEFWCWFYRVKGHHYGYTEDKEKMVEARMQAWSIADSLQHADSSNLKEKEWLFIKCSMEYFSGKEDEALKTMELAKKAGYENPEYDSTENANANIHYNDMMDEIKEMIEKKEE